jgi:hypothetical protein
MRNSYSESGGWGLRIAIGAVVLVVLGAVGLAIYGGRVQPDTHKVEQIVPDDRFPH